ncbi:hypothetical protein GQ44DRAFT_768345 [Phaeosphaeriaceae sp. PMI808]|nr:hypothetical protein GQ44DRAFT_768345 [Phaeosphaeriaceae sp. PMI808]
MSSPKITETHSKKDIQAYSVARNIDIQKKFGLLSGRQRYIHEIVSIKAEGMFLFAPLMMSFLYNQLFISELDKQISPESFADRPLRLDEVYL